MNLLALQYLKTQKVEVTPSLCANDYFTLLAAICAFDFQSIHIPSGFSQILFHHIIYQGVSFILTVELLK